MNYFVLFFFLIGTACAQISKFDEYFDGIVSANQMNDSTVFVIQKKGDYHLLLYDFKNKKLTNRFIPHGDGPGETKSINFVSYDPLEMKFYVSAKNYFFILNADGELLEEKKVLIKNVSYVQSFGQKVNISRTLMITKNDIISNKELNIGVSLNKINFKENVEFCLSPKMLELDQIDNLSNFKEVWLDAFLHEYSENFYVLTVSGTSKAFLFENEKLIKTVELNFPNFKPLQVVSHPSYGFGVQSFPVNTAISQINNCIYISYGGAKNNVGFIKLLFEYSQLRSVERDDKDIKMENLFGIKMVKGKGSSLVFADVPQFSYDLYQIND